MIYLIAPRHFKEIAADFQGSVIDSAHIQPDGTFAFSSSAFPASRSLLTLVVQRSSSRYPNDLYDENPEEANYMPFIYVPGMPIQLEADIVSFQQSLVFQQSSPLNAVMLQLRDIRSMAFRTYTAAQSAMSEDSLLLEKEKAHTDYIGTLMQFADTTHVPEAAFLAIRWISPTNDFERIPEFLTRQCMRYATEVVYAVYAREICDMSDPATLPVMIGDTFPEYSLPLADHDTASLMSLLGDSITIIDLWASWCAPCRKENRNILQPMYAAYKNKGLEIIAYALDAERAHWLSAMEKDGADWIHASELQGDAGLFLSTLRITTIPANYILDAEGVVLAKNLHGEELIQWIEHYFQK